MARIAVSSAENQAPAAGKRVRGFAPEKLIEIYRLMYLSRRTDDREIMLKNQQKDLLPDFVRGARGAAGGCRTVAAPGLRLVLPLLPRPRAVASRWARPSRIIFCRPWAPPPIRPAAGGRCRRTGPSPSGTSSRNRRRRRPSACRRWAARRLDAVLRAQSAGHRGCAERIRSPPQRLSRVPQRGVPRRRRSCTSPSARARPARASSGRRSTSPPTGSCRCWCVVEDNGYAISMPVEVNTPGGNISRLLANSRTSTLRKLTARTRWPAMRSA